MLTPLEVAALTATVEMNDGATAERIGKRLKSATGHTLPARDLEALLCGLVDRRMMHRYHIPPLVPAYSLTPAGLAALESGDGSTPTV